MSGKDDDIQDVPSDYEEDFEGDNDSQDEKIQNKDSAPYTDDVDEFFRPAKILSKAKPITIARKADNIRSFSSNEDLTSKGLARANIQSFAQIENAKSSDSELEVKLPEQKPISQHSEPNSNDRDADDHMSEQSENERDSRGSTPSLPLPHLSARHQNEIFQIKDSPHHPPHGTPPRTVSIQPPRPSYGTTGNQPGSDDDDFPPETAPRPEKQTVSRVPKLKASSVMNRSKSPVTIQKAKLVPAGDRLTTDIKEWQPVKKKPPVPRLGQRRSDNDALGKRSQISLSRPALQNFDGKGAGTSAEDRPSRSSGLAPPKSRPSSTAKSAGTAINNYDENLQEKSNQKERYQLARQRAVDRLKHWKDKNPEKKDISETNKKHAFDSTYTVKAEQDVQREPKLDIRQRQQSVKIPRFSRKNDSTAENAKRGKSNTKSRPSTSVPSRARARSANKPLERFLFSHHNQPLPDLLQKRLVDFTVNDSEHSPKTSYWLFQEAFPELFWLSEDRKELGPLLEGSALDRRKVKMDFFDRMVYATPSPTPPNILRIQYDDMIRQGSRGNSPDIRTRPNSSSAVARSLSRADSRSTKENYSENSEQVRRAEAAVKNQALVKAAEVGDFSSAGLQKVIDDLYGFFCSSRRITSTLTAERIGLLLAHVYDELVSI